jgi:hypothetical protein
MAVFMIFLLFAFVERRAAPIEAMLAAAGREGQDDDLING